MDSFNGILDIGKEEHQKMIKERLIDGKKTVNRFLGILKNKDSKKIRQILLHWCYELS